MDFGGLWLFKISLWLAREKDCHHIIYCGKAGISPFLRETMYVLLISPFRVESSVKIT
jgi:hypothetical protein